MRAATRSSASSHDTRVKPGSPAPAQHRERQPAELAQLGAAQRCAAPPRRPAAPGRARPSCSGAAAAGGCCRGGRRRSSSRASRSCRARSRRRRRGRGCATRSAGWSRFSHRARKTSRKLLGRCSPMPNGRRLAQSRGPSGARAYSARAMHPREAIEPMQRGGAHARQPQARGAARGRQRRRAAQGLVALAAGDRGPARDVGPLLGAHPDRAEHRAAPVPPAEPARASSPRWWPTTA